MKREGRQHGMVRSYYILPSPFNLRPNSRIINRSDSPEIFVKVSSKPTNHSKFTGKCGKPRCPGCHLHPACKAKDKTKGTLKHKHRRVMDEPSSDCFGLSATVILDHIYNDYTEDGVEDEGSDQADCRVNYSGAFDDCDGNNDDNKCISEMGVSFQDQVEEEKEDDDWLLVES